MVDTISSDKDSSCNSLEMNKEEKLQAKMEIASEISILMRGFDG